MNLAPRSIILLTLAAFQGRIEGKTLLQKRLYFLDQLLQLRFRESARFEHDSHYYGPYSPLVGDELASLQALGYVNELTESLPWVTGGFEPRRYTYSLTQAGAEAARQLRANHAAEVEKIDAALAPIKALGSLDYVQVSIAAKCHLIASRSNQPLSAAAAADAARRFSWQVTPEQAQRGFQLLQKLGLAHPTPAKPAEAPTSV